MHYPGSIINVDNVQRECKDSILYIYDKLKYIKRNPLNAGSHKAYIATMEGDEYILCYNSCGPFECNDWQCRSFTTRLCATLYYKIIQKHLLILGGWGQKYPVNTPCSNAGDTKDTERGMLKCGTVRGTATDWQVGD